MCRRKRTGQKKRNRMKMKRNRGKRNSGLVMKSTITGDRNGFFVFDYCIPVTGRRVCLSESSEFIIWRFHLRHFDSWLMDNGSNKRLSSESLTQRSFVSVPLESSSGRQQQNCTVLCIVTFCKFQYRSLKYLVVECEYGGHHLQVILVFRSTITANRGNSTNYRRRGRRTYATNA